ncbi:MAG: DUF2017 family protein [Actinomycetota bacterium]
MVTSGALSWEPGALFRPGIISTGDLYLHPGGTTLFEGGRSGPTALFDEQEADALRLIVSDYLTFMDTPRDPADPVVARLFPSASLDDEKVAAEYKELVQGDLSALKHANARTALQSLGESGGWKAELSEEEQEAWLALLTDLRLIIGVRHDVTEETMDMQLDPSDPDHHDLLLMHYIGGLQESLVQAISEPGDQPLG